MDPSEFEFDAVSQAKLFWKCFKELQAKAQAALGAPEEFFEKPPLDSLGSPNEQRSLHG